MGRRMHEIRNESVNIRKEQAGKMLGYDGVLPRNPWRFHADGTCGWDGGAGLLPWVLYRPPFWQRGTFERAHHGFGGRVGYRLRLQAEYFPARIAARWQEIKSTRRTHCQSRHMDIQIREPHDRH